MNKNIISTEQIPTWALSYLLYGNAYDLTPEDKEDVDSYLFDLERIFGEDLCFGFADEEFEGYTSKEFEFGEGPSYYSSRSAFGYPSQVVDINVYCM